MALILNFNSNKTMKRINSYILTGGVIILGLCGCTSNFDDYNKDPNRAEVGKANSSQMLEDLIFEGAGSMKYRTWRHNNEFMQYTVDQHAESAAPLRAHRQRIQGRVELLRTLGRQCHRDV